jgi:hypothetical protein
MDHGVNATEEQIQTYLPYLVTPNVWTQKWKHLHEIVTFSCEDGSANTSACIKLWVNFGYDGNEQTFSEGGVLHWGWKQANIFQDTCLSQQALCQAALVARTTSKTCESLSHSVKCNIQATVNKAAAPICQTSLISIIKLNLKCY